MARSQDLEAAAPGDVGERGELADRRFLDVLRALGREADSVEAVQHWLLAQRGRNTLYDAWVAGIDLTKANEATARLMVERAALAAQAAVLLEWHSPLADAFCTLRLGERGMAYGAFDARIDAAAILDRAMPA